MLHYSPFCRNFTKYHLKAIPRTKENAISDFILTFFFYQSSLTYLQTNLKTK